jgi:hypothetical protein
VPAAAIYSVRFATITVPSIYATWVCPLGKRAVLRCVTAVNGGTAQGFFYAIAAATEVVEADLQAHRTMVFGDLRMVIYAGETISLTTTAAGIHGTASGYLFSDPGSSAAEDVSYERVEEINLLPSGP